MSCALVLCSCGNDFQDKKYGKQLRVANEIGKPKPVPPKGQMICRCTVCKKEHTVSEGRKMPEGKVKQ